MTNKEKFYTLDEAVKLAKTFGWIKQGLGFYCGEYPGDFKYYEANLQNTLIVINSFRKEGHAGVRDMLLSKEHLNKLEEECKKAHYFLKKIREIDCFGMSVAGQREAMSNILEREYKKIVDKKLKLEGS